MQLSLFKKLKAGLEEALEFESDRKKFMAKVRKREVKIAPVRRAMRIFKILRKKPYIPSKS
jgi:hypothetical protein